MERGGGNKWGNGGGIHDGEEFYLQRYVFLSIRGQCSFLEDSLVCYLLYFPN